MRYPLDAWRSTPSSPPARQRPAAAANDSTTSAIFDVVISIGTDPISGLAMALDDHVTGALRGRVADPGWQIWARSFIPYGRRREPISR